MTFPRTLLLAGLLALSACSQPTAQPDAPDPSATASTPAPLTIGTPGPQQALVTLTLPNLRLFRAQYLNANQTASLSITIDQGTPTVVTPATLSCTPTGCPVNLYVSAGDHTVTLQTFSATGTLISQGTAKTSVLPGSSNTLTLTLTPVAVSVRLKSAVQQWNGTAYGNYTHFRFAANLNPDPLGIRPSTPGTGHSSAAFYDLQATDAVGDVIPGYAVGAVLCGDNGMTVTNVSSAAFPNRYRVEITGNTAHTLTAYAGTTCGTGGAVASQTVTPDLAGDQLSAGSTSSYSFLTLLGVTYNDHTEVDPNLYTLGSWGDDTFHQLGRGQTGHIIPYAVPYAVTFGRRTDPADSPGEGIGNVLGNTVEVYAGRTQGIIRTDLGQVRIWSPTTGTYMLPVHGLYVGATAPVPAALQVAAGGDLTLALLADGTVRSIDAAALTNTPVPGFNKVNPAIQVSAGGVGTSAHGLALMADGTVRQWGPTTEPALLGITGAVQVAAGGQHSLALLADGTVLAWGDNTSGQLGNGQRGGSRDVPVKVTGITAANPAIQVAAGGHHSLALLANGTVLAWGDDTSGQLGNGQRGGSSAVPVRVSGLTNVTRVSAGEKHSLAFSATLGVVAWGDNTFGQLGDATLITRSVPVAVAPCVYNCF